MSQAKVLSINKFVEAVKGVFPGAKEVSIFINRYFIHQSKIENAVTHFTQPLGFVIAKSYFSPETFKAKLGLTDNILISISDALKKQMDNNEHQYWSLAIKCDVLKKGGEFEYYSRGLKYVTSKKIIDVIAPIQEFNDEDIDFAEPTPENVA